MVKTKQPAGQPMVKTGETTLLLLGEEYAF